MRLNEKTENHSVHQNLDKENDAKANREGNYRKGKKMKTINVDRFIHIQ